MLRILLLTTLFLVFLNASAAKEGLEHLNSIRTNTGLIKFKEHRALDSAAFSHAKYLIENQRKGHYEKRGKYAYTGNTPSQRVIKTGYPSAYVMENVSINTSDYKKSIDTLFAAIYHRFVFLTLDKDEIGLGSYQTKKKRKVKQAYVYNLGSSEISKLCKQSFLMENGTYYMKNICKENAKMVPMSLFREKKEVIQRKNSAMVLYPYNKQSNIWPAFYNESPDPLPGYKVSGFPVSIQFNPANTNSVKLKSFRLYDQQGKEIRKTKILQEKNDKNHLFSKFQFALMPLKRLAFNSIYTAVFEAEADGRKVKKQWSFRTTKFEEKLYRITAKKTTLTVKAGRTIILYMVPDSRKDIILSHISRGGAKVSYLDQNTLRVTLPKRRSSGRVSLDLGKKKVFFNIE